MKDDTRDFLKNSVKAKDGPPQRGKKKLSALDDLVAAAGTEAVAKRARTGVPDDLDKVFGKSDDDDL